MDSASTLKALKDKINYLINKQNSKDITDIEKVENKNKIKELRKQVKNIVLEIKFDTQKELKDNSNKLNEDLNKRILELEASKSEKKNTTLYKQSINYEIAKCKIEMLNNDPEFIIRNMLYTKLCPKVIKGKKCNFDGCTFAHTESEIRKPICLFNMFNICNYGEKCIHDHSTIEPPKMPVESQIVHPDVKKRVLKNEDDNKEEFKYCIKTDSKTFYFNDINGSINYILNYL